MEKSVDCEYLQTKHDSSESLETRTRSNRDERSEKRKFTWKGSKERGKKIASEDASDVRRVERRKDAERKERSQEVLNDDEGSTSAVENLCRDDTKIVNRQVPDRLGKFIVTSECVDSEEKSASSEMDFLLKDYSETKLYMIGNECLSNKEAVSFSNSFESDSDGKNIFENFFDDCLGSTSVLPKDASSQEGNGESRGNRFSSGDVLPEATPADSESFGTGGQSSPTSTIRSRLPGTPTKPNKDRDKRQVRHVCTYCQKIFKSNGKLNSHVYSHTGERPFDCNNCGKAFSSKFKLVRHLLIHSEIRKFVCQICDRTFLRNDHLKNHYKVHDPQKKMYKCSKKGCAKEYSSVMSHKKHMAYHSVEDGDLKCSICGVKYETKEEILFHLKSHSGSRLFKSQSDKKFKCQFCDRLFLTRKDVTRHLVVHTGERDFLCQFCPQRFGRKDHLVRHIKKSHVGDASVKNESDDVSTPSDSRNSKKSSGKKSGPDPASECFPDDAETVPSTDEKGIDSNDPASLPEKKKGKDFQTDATRIVITVRGEIERPFRKTNRKSNEEKNSATTQILLRNVPNILIIPNSSIILVGNPEKRAERKTEDVRRTGNPKENEKSRSRESPEEIGSGLGYNFQDPETNDFPPSQFPSAFPETDAFSNFNAADLTDFNPDQFEEAESSLGFDLKPAESLLNLMEPSQRNGNENDDNNNNNNNTSGINEIGRTANENLLSEASRQIRLLETGMNAISSIPSEFCKKVGIVKPMAAAVKIAQPTETDKDFFEGGSEGLILNDSILNDFKAEEEEEESSILRLGTDCAILSSILQQPNELSANESILRNFLAPENPSVFSSPLPGFSQIFQNSNANPN